MDSTSDTSDTDTDEEEAGLYRSQITKKKTYFDIIKHTECADIRNGHSLVGKSIGSINLTKSILSDTKLESNDGSSAVENSEDERPIFPWKLYNAEPTTINQIRNRLVLNKILEGDKSIDDDEEEEKMKRIKLFFNKIVGIDKSINDEGEVKFNRIQLFINIICRKLRRKRDIREVKKEVRIFEGMLPEEEFEQLQEKYLKEGLLKT